jgi:hypothetical protein
MPAAGGASPAPAGGEGKQAPFGNSGATQPTPNAGMEAAALQRVGVLVKQVQDIMQLVGAGSEPARTCSRFSTFWSRWLPAGNVSNASERNMLEQSLMRNTQNGAMQQQLKQQSQKPPGSPVSPRRRTPDGSRRMTTGCNIFKDKTTMPGSARDEFDDVTRRDRQRVQPKGRRHGHPFGPPRANERRQRAAPAPRPRLLRRTTMPNIFENSTKTLPKSDEQIVRVDMEQIDIGGRKSHLPAQDKSSVLPISHTPNKGGNVMAKVEIDEAEFVRLHGLNNFAHKMLQDPKLASCWRRPRRLVDPNVKTPRLDAAAQSAGAGQESCRTSSPRCEADRGRQVRGRAQPDAQRAQSQRDDGISALRRQGWTDEGIKGVETLMERRASSIRSMPPPSSRRTTRRRTPRCRARPAAGISWRASPTTPMPTSRN